MATLEQRLSALAAAIGADIKTLNAAKGDLSALTTTQKSNLVGAINELKTLISNSSGTAEIDDAALTSSTTKTWSASKITTQINQLKTDLLNGAPTTFDTLKEIADYIASDQSAGTALATAVANRVRVDDVMTLTAAQKTQACTNIGAVETATAGDITVDLAAAYATAKV